MLTIRPAQERGEANHGWLHAFHSFSFADYHDPRHMGFRTLRVLNDDTIEPGQGFGTHGHRDMEIITYVLEGALEHKDSLGSGGVLKPGDVQYMNAGHGVRHSEFNHSPDKKLKLLQIWVHPKTSGLDPEYAEAHFSAEEKMGRLRLLASPDGREGSLRVHQDFHLYASILEKNQKLDYEISPGRHVWIQVAHGNLEVNGQALGPGDGVAVSEEDNLQISGVDSAEFLLFDLD
jgi:quercetin 2,3-dioxygenase